MSYIWETKEHDATSDLDKYYSYPRLDILDRVGIDNPMRKVLEVGCGSGATGVVAKERWPDTYYIGVELNEKAAEKAKKNVDEIRIGKIEDHLPFKDIPQGSLDLVIAGDVLEHLYNPWQVLKDIKPFISKEGKIIASIPNSRNLFILDQLKKGIWRYENSGLLDFTHIRFFTITTALEMFEEAGYEIEDWTSKIDGRFFNLLEHNQSLENVNIDLGGMQIQATRKDFFDLCTLQYIIEAVPTQL